MLDQPTRYTSDESRLRTRYDNFVGGKWAAPVKGRYFTDRSPIDGSILCDVARSDADDVERALDAAHAALPGWARTSPAERARILNKIADRIEENLALLARVETRDNGKPIRETMNADVPLAADHFRYFAGCIRAEEGTIGEIDHDTVAYHFREPMGVVGQIIPWNFPLLMAAWKLAPALVCGNCVVMKPASDTPMSLAVLMDLIGDLLPPGVLNVVLGHGSEVGAPLARSPRIAKIAFTGETTTGRQIMQYAAETIIPQTMELGGKSPNIFFDDVMDEDDAFLDKALEGFALFAFNKGEVCTCPSRALVHEKIFDRFLEKAVARVARIKVGDPLDQSTQMGAQCSQGQLEKILEYINVGKQEGATCMTGGERADLGGRLKGWFLPQAHRVRRAQQDAHLPGGNLRARAVSDEVQGPRRCDQYRQRYRLRSWRRRVVAQCQQPLSRRPRHPGRPGVDQLLSCLSGPRRLRRLQGIGVWPRDAQADHGALPADQEPAGELQHQCPGSVLIFHRPPWSVAPAATEHRVDQEVPCRLESSSRKKRCP
jgi:aldehyde dehydrogenase